MRWSGPADLQVVVGDARRTTGEAGVDPVLTQVTDGRVLFAAYPVEPSTDGGRWHLVVPSLATFDVGADRIVAHPDPRLEDERLLPLLLAGTVLSFWMMVRGGACLHASAIEQDDAWIAIAGSSGRGKSTLAALACAAGARLVADDLLRLTRTDGGGLVAWRGASELRLRPAATHLAELVPGGSRTTADGRLALSPPTTAVEHAPLRAIVLPRPDRSVSRVAIRRLVGSVAVRALLECPRLTGWAEPGRVDEQFGNLVDLAATVPVIEAHVPWMTPLQPHVARELMDEVRAATDDASGIDATPITRGT